LSISPGIRGAAAALDGRQLHAFRRGNPAGRDPADLVSDHEHAQRRRQGVSLAVEHPYVLDQHCTGRQGRRRLCVRGPAGRDGADHGGAEGGTVEHSIQVHGSPCFSDKDCQDRW
jgi:hypothetical protein